MEGRRKYVTTIYLVRHGETAWNAERRMQGQTDIPLNEKGMQQADACGAALNPADYNIIISSHLKRAKQTAEIINTYLQLPFEQMEEFAERSFGDGEGLTMDERLALYPDHQFPNQEELEDFSNRIMGGMEKVAATYPGKQVLLVAHGAVINRILSIVSNGELGSGKTMIENTSITTISLADGQWIIQNYNQIDHLQRLETQPPV